MKKCRSCQKEIDNKATKCPYCQEKQGNWAQRHPILTGILGIIVFFIVINAGSSDKNAPSNQPDSPEPAAEVIETNDPVEETSTEPVDDKPSETVSQKNALRKAKSYLDMSGFSKNGLIKQLEFEKFSNEDAVYAADNIGADWNKQAERKAKSYLDMSGFSRDSLIKQLEFEGFTNAEAVHGADAVGL